MVAHTLLQPQQYVSQDRVMCSFKAICHSIVSVMLARDKEKKKKQKREKQNQRIKKEKRKGKGEDSQGRRDWWFSSSELLMCSISFLKWFQKIPSHY